MNDQIRIEHIETLARMAAQLAGRDPDEYVLLKLADVVAFDDVIWRYPDFLARAEAAYGMLTKDCLAHPASRPDKASRDTAVPSRHDYRIVTKRT